MRLLNVHDFEFQQYKDPPSYAILSHRWSTEEWLLKDVEQRRDTAGFRLTKIYGFAEYVKKHFSTDWIWIDSCCINQDSAAELSESINSMSKWYKNAMVCIAYLSDIDTEDFTTSVWFTRGWTLQELLMPETLVFLTVNWKLIGDKETLKPAIASRTGIPLNVLTKFDDSQTSSKEERLQWMKGRETQRDEDMFYALFGIFDVTPGANYGEGKDGARRRLFDAIDRKDGTHRFSQIMTSFGLPDPWVAHEALRQRHVPGTGWLKWTDGHVWLHGKSGCGKTFLAFAMIEDQPSEAFAFFYFPGTYQDLLKSLVRQLGWRELEHYQRQPTMTEMENIVIKVSESNPARVVLDGLDQRNGRPDSLDRLQALVKNANMTLFLTSREAPDIREMMTELGSREIHITPKATEDDIRNYTVSQLGQGMADKILQHADGMFTWVVHMVDELSTVKTLDNITLTHCPAGLEEVYAEGLRSINKLVRPYAKTVLQWLAYSYADLTVDQLLEVMTIREDRVEVGLPGEPQVLTMLSSLIEVSNNKVKLVHPSLRAYLESDQLRNDILYFQLDSQRGHHFLEQSCITYLIHGQGPLSSYAVHFHHHTKVIRTRLKSPTSTAVSDLLVEDGLFTGSYPSLMHAATTRGHVEVVKLMIKHGTRVDDDLLYTACAEGHLGIVLVLLNAGARVKQGGPLGHPLTAAAANNHVSVVQFLLALGTIPRSGKYGPALQVAAQRGKSDVVRALLATEDVNAGGGIYGSPLQAASAHGHADIVSLLLKHGALVDARSGIHSTALCAASYGGRTNAVRLLLRAGADKEASTFFSGTALSIAADRGHADIVALLINAGANIEAKSRNDWTPLSIASFSGKAIVVDLLLKAGAKTESVSIAGRTPLFHAAANGHSEAVQLLLSAKANLDVVDSAGMTPINMACRNRRWNVVDILLPRTKALDTADHNGYTPIHYAVHHGCIRAVQQVRAAGANINIPDKGGWTPFHKAIDKGYSAILKLLCDADVDVNVPNREGWSTYHETVRHSKVRSSTRPASAVDINAPNHNGDTPLHTAASQQSSHMLELLLTFPVNIAVPNQQKLTPLHMAVAKGCMYNTISLLAASSDVDDVDDMGFTPLAVAVEKGYTLIVRLLLDVGADPIISTAWGEPPVCIAAYQGNVEILQLFEEHTRTHDNKTPLFIAARCGHINIVKMLAVTVAASTDAAMVVHDASQEDHSDTAELLRDAINVADDHGQTPLFAAATYGHTEIVKLLLEAGATFNQDNQGWTPFTIACQRGHIDVMKLLLPKSDPKAPSDIWTAINAAASNGQAQVVELLIEFGQLDIPDSPRMTPIMTAASNGHLEVVRFLGTDCRAALHLACQGGHIDVVRFLLRRGGLESVHNGRTPLMEASRHGRSRVAQLLIDKGASIAGSLSLAAAHGHFQVAKLLIEDAEEQDMANSITEAALNGHVEVVRLLLEQGVNSDAALQVAAAHGHVEVVRLLIETCRKYDDAMNAASKAGHTEVVELLLQAASSPQFLLIPAADTLDN